MIEPDGGAHRMSSEPSGEIRASGARLAWFLAIAYLLLVAYASLSPFTGWREPAGEAIAFLTAPWPRYWTWFDLFINVLAYVPLGLLIALAVLAYLPREVALLAAVILGGLISFGFEFVQAFLPGRKSSNVDLLMNVTGALMGAMIAVRTGSLDFARHRFESLRARFHPGARADLGLALVALWLFSQLDPSLPLLGNIASLGNPGTAPASDLAPPRVSVLETGAAMFTLFAVGLMLTFVVRKPWHALAGAAIMAVAAALIKLVGAVLLLKPEARFGWLSRDVWIGAGYALGLTAVFMFAPERVRRYACALSLLVVIVATQVFSSETRDLAFLKLFDWHYGQLLNFTGLAHTVAKAWPFLALGWLYLGRSRKRAA